MESVAGRLGPVLQVGETHAEREERRQKRGRVKEESVRGVDGGEGGEGGEGERKRKLGRNVLWEEDIYQEPADAIPHRERRLTSYF